ncbi:polysulfide reductase NrfD [Calidifontibacter sp. DB0510]|uniref:Polysulfide reductase NrfD n=1 Tax=Metallococcus carri TaxID=1656884 RepID=A0A967B180_9MICO|nr:NrfD/PsrC family molybdoenzyme membrane anchor subunit [Metallococcus carri]NHN56139.1 polysulfide reductase NrfD [Metallococcus carri]NOP38811.1 polysulfide reductase NrfD [Calidifontibacter sp. DB2511S]
MTTSEYDSYRPPEPPKRQRGNGFRRRASGWLTGRGEGRGEQALVPDAQFTSYYGRPVVKPVPWGPTIPAYLFLGGLAGGSQLLAMGAHATGNAELRRATRLVSAAAVALSGAALVEDLGKKSRFVNMLRTLKVTSPMSVGSWILSAFSAGAMPVAVAEIDRLRPLPGGGLVRAIETPAQVVGAAFATPLASYTAVLLSNTATPTWHAAYKELPFVFVGSAAAASGGMAMVLTSVRAAGPARRLAVLGVAGDLIAMRILEGRLGVEGETLHHGMPGRLTKLSMVLNVAGGLGTLVAGRSRIGAALSGAALVGASVATRFGVFEAGMESARDPRYTIEPQRQRLAARQGKDSITTA